MTTEDALVISWAVRLGHMDLSNSDQSELAAQANDLLIANLAGIISPPNYAVGTVGKAAGISFQSTTSESENK